MRLWWRLATRNWFSSPGRTLAAVLSVALGVSVVVTVTSFHETALVTLRKEVVERWLGSAHLLIHPPDAHWGSLDAAVADQIQKLDGVARVSKQLSRRVAVRGASGGGADGVSAWHRAQAIGIEPDAFAHQFALTELDGRGIEPGDKAVVVMERATAAACSVGIGDTLDIVRQLGAEPLEVKVVALFDTERIADFQADILYVPLAALQQHFEQPGVVNAIQITLDNPTTADIDAAEAKVKALVARLPDAFAYRVESARSRQILLEQAESITRAVIIIIAFVALLTAFFIIVTTMSMSLFERRSQLGVLRCVGTTRSQLACLVFMELLPLGAVGTLLGVLMGAGFTSLVGWLIAGRADAVLWSEWGLRLAVVSGMMTAVLSALLLVVQICRVSPLAAVRTHARAVRRSAPYICGAIGVAFLIAHEAIVRMPDQSRWLDPTFAFTGVLTLYLGYVLVVPMLVVAIGRPVARCVGPLLGLSGKLVQDQFGKSPWRGTGVCWVLMVGLSLTVYLGIDSTAATAIWDFPAKLPEAFVWSPQYMPGSTLASVRRVPGVTKVAITTDIACEIGEKTTASKSATQSLMKMLTEKLLRPVFVAAETDDILAAIKVAFIEGTQEEAVAKLERGGYVLIPVQTSRNKNLHLGDKVTITIEGKTAELEIAGVVQSPALDVAVTAFQATSYMQIAAASAILGTERDLREKFGVDAISMFMFDLDLPDAGVPPDFDPQDDAQLTKRSRVVDAMLRWEKYLPNETATLAAITPALRQWQEAGGSAPLPPDVEREVARFEKSLMRVYWAPNRERFSPGDAWAIFRERLVMHKVADVVDRPSAIMGSLRRLRMQLERGLEVSTAVIPFLPSILLFVAAVGIANLMMVSVQIRARQLAVLRAVGALKSQVLRLVLAEAVALALVGSVAGVALGMHEAWTDLRVTDSLGGLRLDYVVPWVKVAIGVAITVFVCLVAGFGPARYAARNNVVEAMRVT